MTTERSGFMSSPVREDPGEDYTRVSCPATLRLKLRRHVVGRRCWTRSRAPWTDNRGPLWKVNRARALIIEKVKQAQLLERDWHQRSLAEPDDFPPRQIVLVPRSMR
jgi:hypothetical protein